MIFLASSPLTRSRGASGLKLDKPFSGLRVGGLEFFRRRIASSCELALSGIRGVPACAGGAETPVALAFSVFGSHIVMTRRGALERTFTKAWMVE